MQLCQPQARDARVFQRRVIASSDMGAQLRASGFALQNQMQVRAVLNWLWNSKTFVQAEPGVPEQLHSLEFPSCLSDRARGIPFPDELNRSLLTGPPIKENKFARKHMTATRAAAHRPNRQALDGQTFREHLHEPRTKDRIEYVLVYGLSGRC